MIRLNQNPEATGFSKSLKKAMEKNNRRPQANFVSE
jgi:hypothetical protein